MERKVYGSNPGWPGIHLRNDSIPYAPIHAGLVPGPGHVEILADGMIKIRQGDVSVVCVPIGTYDGNTVVVHRDRPLPEPIKA